MWQKIKKNFFLNYLSICNFPLKLLEILFNLTSPGKINLMRWSLLLDLSLNVTKVWVQCKYTISQSPVKYWTVPTYWIALVGLYWSLLSFERHWVISYAGSPTRWSRSARSCGTISPRTSWSLQPASYSPWGSLWPEDTSCLTSSRLRRRMYRRPWAPRASRWSGRKVIHWLLWFGGPRVKIKERLI